jgi:hypothetical protein
MTELDANVRHIVHLEADFYEETPEVRSSPRGIAEASIASVEFWEGPTTDTLTMKLDGAIYYVPFAALEAALGLRDSGDGS